MDSFKSRVFVSSTELSVFNKILTFFSFSNSSDICLDILGVTILFDSALFKPTNSTIFSGSIGSIFFSVVVVVDEEEDCKFKVVVVINETFGLIKVVDVVEVVIVIKEIFTFEKLFSTTISCFGKEIKKNKANTNKIIIPTNTFLYFPKITINSPTKLC